MTTTPAKRPATITLDDLLTRIANTYSCVAAPEAIPLRAALGRVLADRIVSASRIPSFDNSAVDGWAVRVADLGDGPRALPIGGRIAAGHPLAGGIRPGFAYRIFTGAPVPAGLDAVAMQEDCTADAETVAIPAMRLGENLRRAGETIEIGQTALKAGCRLRAQEIGLAAMLGFAELPVRRRLRVAMFSTGDELREVGTPLDPGCIYDSNRHTLFGLLDALGCDITDLGIVADTPDAVRDAMTRAARGQDLVITTGGASVGEEDHIKTVLAELGEITQWKVAIKPGKPVVLGRIGDTPFVGLPGNPVSVMVTFLLVARPIVARLGGLDLAPPQRYPLPALFALAKKGGRREFRRAAVVVRDGRIGVDLLHSESSAVLTSMTVADGLIDLPEPGVEIAPGDMVWFLPLRELQP